MNPAPLNQLRENKPIRLRVLGTSDWYKSRVEAVAGRFVHVAHPVNQVGRLIPLRPLQDIEIGFTVTESYYTFLTAILDIRRKPVPFLILERPEETEMIGAGRRVAPRVNSLIPMAYEIQGGMGFAPAHHTMALNLSATGLAFNSVTPLSARTRLKIEVHLPSMTGSASATGEVVACSQAPNSLSGRFKVRVKFVTITKTSAQRIGDFVKDKKEQQKRLQ